MQERSTGQQLKDLVRYTGVLFKESILHPRTNSTVILDEATGEIQVFRDTPDQKAKMRDFIVNHKIGQ